MKPRDKKPKCTSANKACGMACKPKAAICADQRKKLLANAKKGGLKGQEAKNYVQARIDRYKKLIGSQGKDGAVNRVTGGGTAFPSSKHADVEKAYKNVRLIHEKLSPELAKLDLNIQALEKAAASPVLQKLNEDIKYYLGKTEEESNPQAIKEAYAKYRALDAEALALYNPSDLIQLYASKEDIIYRPEVLKAHDTLKTALMESGLSRREAQTQVKKIKMSEDIRKQRETQVVEFVRLLGSVPPTLKNIVDAKNRRAFANQYAKNIGLHKYTSKNTVFHEIGHHLEFNNPELMSKAKKWVVGRSTGGTEKLSKITGNSAYDNYEMAYPGNFIDPYVGKIYADGGGEAISMGIENFAFDKNMAKFYHKDPSHYDLIVQTIKEYQSHG